MDLAKIKNFIKQNGDKFVFVENGEPEVVVMSFHEYQRLVRDETPDIDPSFQPDAYSEMNEAQFSEPRVPESTGLPVRLEDIRLEDLPI